MKKYETPDIKFDELTFFENIACDCWSSNQFTMDFDNNGKTGPGEQISIQTSSYKGGCRPNMNVGKLIEEQYFDGNSKKFQSWSNYSGYNQVNTFNNTGIKNFCPCCSCCPCPRPTPRPKPGC